MGKWDEFQPKGFVMCNGCYEYSSPLGGCQRDECRWKHPYPDFKAPKREPNSRWKSIEAHREMLLDFYSKGYGDKAAVDMLEAVGVKTSIFTLRRWRNVNGVVFGFSWRQSKRERIAREKAEQEETEW